MYAICEKYEKCEKREKCETCEMVWKSELRMPGKL